jgi:hypothetical protein
MIKKEGKGAITYGNLHGWKSQRLWMRLQKPCNSGMYGQRKRSKSRNVRKLRKYAGNGTAGYGTALSVYGKWISANGISSDIIPSDGRGAGYGNWFRSKGVCVAGC